ncbi:MAG: hypothetical protein ABI388_13225 [Bacteroidia bacterium]
METNKSNSASETLLEGAQTTNKWMNDASSAMMDMYKKQTDMASSFYSNLFNSFSGANKNSFNPMANFSNPFSNNHDMMKNMFTPFNAFGMNTSSSNPFEKAIKQLTDFNQNLLSSLGKPFGNGNQDFGALTENYKNVVEKEVEASKKMIETLTAAYHKQMEFTMENNKKLQEEMSAQFNQLVKLTQQFWAGAVNNAEQLPHLIEKFSKDGVAGDKKQTKVTT